jgi:hypothetical protein
MKALIYIVLFPLFFLCSCEKDLDMSQIAFKEKLVVNLLAYDNDFLSVTVNKSLDIFDSIGKPSIENALVIVTDDKGVKTKLNFDLISQSYRSTWYPVSGINYTLEVTWGNLSSTYSFFTIPKLSTSGKALWIDNTSTDSVGFPTGTISFIIKDNPNERNYYEIGLFRYDEFSSEPWLNLPIIPENPELVNNQILNKDGALLIDDGGFNGQNKLFKFTTPANSKGTTFKYLVVIKNLSEEYYRYFKSIDNYKQQQGPFSEPSAVFTNIKGGLGICAGASVVKDTIK